MKTKLLKRIRSTANDLFRVTNIIITNSRVTSVSTLCPTLEDAKAVAGRHFNKKIEEFLDSIKFLTDEDK